MDSSDRQEVDCRIAVIGNHFSSVWLVGDESLVTQSLDECVVIRSRCRQRCRQSLVARTRLCSFPTKPVDRGRRGSRWQLRSVPQGRSRPEERNRGRQRSPEPVWCATTHGDRHGLSYRPHPPRRYRDLVQRAEVWPADDYFLRLRWRSVLAGRPSGSGRDRPEEAARPARGPVGRRAGRVAGRALKT